MKELDVAQLLSRSVFDRRLSQLLPYRAREPFRKIFICCHDEEIERLLVRWKNSIPPFAKQIEHCKNFAVSIAKSSNVPFDQYFAFFERLVGVELCQKLADNFAIFYRECGTTVRVHLRGLKFRTEFYFRKKRVQSTAEERKITVELEDGALRCFKTQFGMSLKASQYTLDRISMMYHRNVSGKLNKLKEFAWLTSNAKNTNFIAVVVLAKNEINPLLTINSEAKRSPNMPIFSLNIDYIVRKFGEKFEKCNVHSLLEKFCPILGKKKKKIKKLRSLQMEELLALKTTKKQLFGFIHSLFHKIFDSRIFATKKNARKFEENLKTIITSGPMQVYHIWDLAANLDLRAMRSLFKGVYTNPKYSSNYAGHIEIAFLNWIYTQIMLILKAKFYITESSSMKEMQFFRYDLWTVIVEKEISALVSKKMWSFRFVQPKESEKAVNQKPRKSSSVQESNRDVIRKSKCRFIPKATSLRAITAFKYSTDKPEYQFFPTIKMVLQRIIRHTEEHSLPFANRLLQFKRAHPTGPYYVVKGDIQNCYPSIDQMKLLQFCRDDLEQFKRFHGIDTGAKSLEFRCFDIVRNKSKFCSVKRDFLVKSSKYEFISGPDILLKNVAHQFGSTVLSKRISIQTGDNDLMSLTRFLSILKIYITQNEVHYANRAYQLLVGIRQGAAFSPQLCELYLQHLSRDYFAAFEQHPTAIFARHVDDLLLVSTDLETAQQFAGICLKGFPDYNLTLKREKFQTNFDLDSGRILPNTVMNFVGKNFDCDNATLSITLDGFRVKTTPFMLLNEAIESFKRQNLVHCFEMFEHELVGDHQLLINIFEFFALNALRMHVYLSRHYLWKRQNHRFELIEFIDEIVADLCLALRRRRTSSHNYIKRHNLRLIAVASFRLVWKKPAWQRGPIRAEEYKYLSCLLESMNNSPLMSQLPHSLPEKFSTVEI